MVSGVTRNTYLITEKNPNKNINFQKNKIFEKHNNFGKFSNFQNSHIENFQNLHFDFSAPHGCKLYRILLGNWHLTCLISGNV